MDKSLQLPQPFVDPQHQKLPPVQASFSCWFLENISFDRKRKSSNEDESEKKKLSENGISDSGHAFSLSDGVKQPLKLVALNGGSLMYPNSVSSSLSSPTVEKNSSKRMECLICHKVLMDDSKFILCSLIDYVIPLHATCGI